MTCAAFVLGIATFGCGSDEAPVPVATDVAPSTTEGPLFTRNSTEGDTSPAASASTSTAPGSTSTDAASTTTIDAASTTSTVDATTGSETVTTTATSVTSTTVRPTTSAPAATGIADQEDIDAGVLAVKEFLVDLLGDGIRIIYDDIDLDDAELSCVGRTEAEGRDFADVLFDCLDDDSYDIIAAAGAGFEGP